MLNDNQQFDFLDMITIFTAIIQIMDYTLTVEQASNDDILKELKRDMAKIESEIREIKTMLSEIC